MKPVKFKYKLITNLTKLCNGLKRLNKSSCWNIGNKLYKSWTCNKVVK